MSSETTNENVEECRMNIDIDRWESTTTTQAVLEAPQGQNDLPHYLKEKISRTESITPAVNLNEDQDFNLCGLPNEVLGGFVFNYLNDVDLSSIHNLGSDRMKDLSEKGIQGAKVMVVNGFGYNAASILTASYNDIKKGVCQSICNVPIGVYGVFGGKCNDNVIVGNYKSAYMYCYKRDEWIQVQDEKDVQFHRFDAKGCILKESLLLCGGSLGNRVELMQIKKDGEDKENTIRNGGSNIN